MAVVTGPIGLQELMVYRKNNPVKFLHKYGEVDFNNLPPNFADMLPYYKMLVARERVRRDSTMRPQNIPAITPWTIFPAPLVEAKAVPVEAVIATAEAKGEVQTVTASEPLAQGSSTGQI